MPDISVERIHFGFLVAPADTRDAGQPIPVVGYLVRHPDALFLFDTGFARIDAGTRERYRPQAVSVEQALAGMGLRPTDVEVVANCHLHADHGGGNAAFPGVPIYVQRPELEAAREPDYTNPAGTHDFPGARLEVIDGEAEPLPGIRLVPTPGHSPGHQSLAVSTGSGWLVLAGQAFTTASEFGFALFSDRLARAGKPPIGQVPDWMERIAALDPSRVYFAHDLLVHERDTAALGNAEPI
jgi:glyoxylase-like metal-dependent hydrolase (beta-lactamase superfamily II)